MVLVIGWIALGIGGAYAFGVLVLAVRRSKRDFETVPAGIVLGASAALVWIVFVAWLSPMTISFNG